MSSTEASRASSEAKRSGESPQAKDVSDHVHLGALRIALQEVGLEKAPREMQLQEKKACPAPCLPKLLKLMQVGVTLRN